MNATLEPTTCEVDAPEKYGDDDDGMLFLSFDDQILKLRDILMKLEGTKYCNAYLNLISHFVGNFIFLRMNCFLFTISRDFIYHLTNTCDAQNSYAAESLLCQHSSIFFSIGGKKGVNTNAGQYHLGPTQLNCIFDLILCYL